MREHLGRPLIGAHHADNPSEGRIVELLSPLEKSDEFLEQSRDSFCVTTAKDDLVAPDRDRRGGELTLDLTQVLVTRAGERGEQVLTGNDDPHRGVGGCHAEPIMRGRGRLQRRRRRRRRVDSSGEG